MSASGRHGKNRRPLSTRNLTLLVVLLTLAVMLLGGLVLFVQLKPPTRLSTASDRDLQANLRALEENPDDPWAWAAVGVAYADKGDVEAAKDAFETSLEKDDKVWISNFQLGLLLRDSDPKRAEELIEKSAELAPRTYRVAPYSALGDLRLEAGNAKAAKKAYLYAVADDPFIVDAQRGLADALLELGDEEGALDHYKKALRMAPGDEELKTAIDELESSLGGKKDKEKK